MIRALKARSVLVLSKSGSSFCLGMIVSEGGDLVRDRAGVGVLMLTHAQVWSAIDRLAARAGLSASGLAKRAGLDPTTFNKSKRITPQGRARWPSTESIAKALAATGTPFDAFVALIEPAGGSVTVKPVPLLGFAEKSRRLAGTDPQAPRQFGVPQVAIERQLNHVLIFRLELVDELVDTCSRPPALHTARLAELRIEVVRPVAERMSLH